MAKVFPAPNDPGDLPLRAKQLHELSFLARLGRDRKDKLLKYPGAMWIRHVGRGEVICRQNDEGSTAFFILRGTDLFRLRHLFTSGDAPENPAAVALIDEVIGKIQPKRRERLEKAFQADQELARRRKAIQDRLDSRVAADAQLKKVIQDVEKSGDKARVATLKALFSATPDKKREAAMGMAAEQPDIAKLLRESAMSPEEVKNWQKEEEFLRTADPDEKYARAKQIADKDPKLAAILRTSAQEEEDAPPFAEVQLAGGQDKVRTEGWFARLKNRFRSSPKDEYIDDDPRSLPADGPAEVDFRTRRATILEGDLFGEMACLNRRPRSATVRAMRDGFLLEILGNVLDEIDKDADYQKERQRVYRQRVLELHLRDLGLFKELSNEEYGQVLERIRDKVELLTFSSGQIVCDEHDRSDGIYMVRDGFVQVVKNISALLKAEDVRAESKLAELAKGSDKSAAAVVKLLPEKIAKAIQNATGSPARPLRVAAAIGFNEVIKSPKLAQMPEMKSVLESDRFKQRAYYLPADRKTWNDSQTRRANRLLLEEIFTGCFEPLSPPSPNGDAILTYLSRGEFFGEIGVVEKLPRSATCIAYGQPRLHTDQKEFGRVELVRISQELVHELLDLYPNLREKIKKVIEVREEQTRKTMEQQATVNRFEGMNYGTSESSRLGLIQGQQLMLIDLERCTRCDECVKACVDSHEDGRTRLFLTGPRFGKYLVPFTCRSCLDPVCMIGCPVRSIQRGNNLEIQIKDWCIGCGICARQCPYNSIQIHPLREGEGQIAVPEGDELVDLRGRAAVCDLCSSLPDQDPRCVYACPHEAALRVNFGKDFAAVEENGNGKA